MDKSEVIELFYLGLVNKYNLPLLSYKERAKDLYDEHFRFPISTMCPCCDAKLEISVTENGCLKTHAIPSSGSSSQLYGIKMDEQKVVDLITEWLIAARESPKDTDASLRLSAKTVYYEILRHLKHSDDLIEIRIALGLPDDTPEPLVGLIWRLQQRIEELEVVDKVRERYVARVRIDNSSGDIIVGSGGCIFTTPLSKPAPTHPSVEAAINAIKDVDGRLPHKSTKLVQSAHTGETVRRFSPSLWAHEMDQG